MNIPIDFNDGPTVTLEEILLAKEQRVLRQQMTISRYNAAIISLTLVMPGPIKKNSAADYLFKQAIKAIKNQLDAHNIPILSQQYNYLTTGHEAILAVNFPAMQLKSLCIALEIDHPLGRLWDIDVIDPISQTSVSRSQFAFAPRRCLVCGQEAKVCGRMRKHTMDELFAAMAKIVNDDLSAHA